MLGNLAVAGTNPGAEQARPRGRDFSPHARDGVLVGVAVAAVHLQRSLGRRPEAADDAAGRTALASVGSAVAGVSPAAATRRTNASAAPSCAATSAKNHRCSRNAASGLPTLSPTSAVTPNYVALGDSYAAGPLIPLQRDDPWGCLRSTNNYAGLIAPSFAGSSSAT